jgi:hypothetical protein
LHFRALDGSISAILLLWFQTFASVNPIWARTTAMELVFGCMLTGPRHVTQAIATTSPIQGGAYQDAVKRLKIRRIDIVPISSSRSTRRDQEDG